MHGARGGEEGRAKPTAGSARGDAALTGSPSVELDDLKLWNFRGERGERKPPGSCSGGLHSPVSMYSERKWRIIKRVPRRTIKRIKGLAQSTESISTCLNLDAFLGAPLSATFTAANLLANPPFPLNLQTEAQIHAGVEGQGSHPGHEAGW